MRWFMGTSWGIFCTKFVKNRKQHFFVDFGLSCVTERKIVLLIKAMMWITQQLYNLM